MAYGTKPGSLDTWDGYPEERESIFDYIGAEKIDGVFILAADRHRSDAWKMDRKGAYPLYEFMSSKLINNHTHAIMPHSLFGYNEKNSFGTIEFDTDAKDPNFTYIIKNIDNEVKGSLKVYLSEISFK